MTARAGTDEEAANLALAHLKQPPIARLTDDNSRARAINAVFAVARDAALRMEWWNFAKTYKRVAATANVTLEGPFKTAYPLPEDCLEVRWVEDAGVAEWEVRSAAADPAGSDAEVSILATNLSAPLICYTRRVETFRLWDPEALVTFSYFAASFAGAQLGASATRIKELEALAQSWREQAAGDDARESASSEVSRNTSWVSARRLGGSAGRR